MITMMSSKGNEGWEDRYRAKVERRERGWIGKAKQTKQPGSDSTSGEKNL